MAQNNDYVKELVNEIEKSKSESFKKARAYLESVNFLEKTLEEKKDFLISEDGVILLEGMSTDKLTILAISNCLAISQKEFHKVSRENPEVYDAIDRGRATEFNAAEKALMSLVTGYFKTETKTTEFKNERNPIGTEQKQSYEKWFPPNGYLVTYYMNNKKKMEYKEKQIELEAARNTIFIDMVIIGDDELVIT